MTIWKTPLILYSFAIFASAEEVSVPDFGEKESCGKMAVIIQEKATKGATVVRFPTGQWKWHDLTRMELPSKKEMARHEFERDAQELVGEVRKWITTNDVRAVVVVVNDATPADTFFKIERVLTDLHVPYGLASGGNVDNDKIRLIETDGRVVSIPHEQPKGEQDAAEQPATAGESK